MNKDPANSKTNKNGNSDSAKVKFSETAEGEVKTVSIIIDPSVRHKYGRRSTVCEALLGNNFQLLNRKSDIFRSVQIGNWLL